MLDYKLIEALAMVVREGGFEKAAQKLYITQSVVSQRIKLLEEQTGQIVLARTNPPQATPSGRQMIKHYLQVKRLEDDLLESFVPTGLGEFALLSVGVNGDSLATWFLEAIFPFISQSRVLLDLVVDDQEQTHRLLKQGEVIGCISTKDQAMQGCRMEYLGQMDYRLLSTPEFAKQWFPNGLRPEYLARAPFVIFNRSDQLHQQFFKQIRMDLPDPLPIHYLPSSEKFVDFIASGLAYGMLPDQQSRELLKTGALMDLDPTCQVQVKLFWHCWNLKSRLLDRLTEYLVNNDLK